MTSLSAFLCQNAIQNEHIYYPVSPRFLDENNKPVEWELRCITSAEDEALRRDCTKRVPVPGRKGQYTQDVDFNLYLGKLAVRCVVFPNLDDVELQNSYGVMGAEALLKTMLKPGEFANLMAKVQEINGFDQSMEDLVDEAKN